MNAQERVPLHKLARQQWDLLIIGGGITGAGIFREAAVVGLRTLLVERDDFAAGTSSHSAKLVHGGLHYLSRFQFGLARESIRERNSLLQEGSGLVDTLDFLLPVSNGDRKHSYAATIGLGVYHAIGGDFRGSPHLARAELELMAPGLDGRYQTAHRYMEAQTDDARLTLRVLAAGQRVGGLARNYTEAVAFTRDRHGKVNGADLHDLVSGETASVAARFVVNAAGPWSDNVRAGIGRLPRQRIVGGSHLVFPHERVPVDAGMAVYHPDSGLPLYVVPWRGVTLVGTTHIDIDPDAGQPRGASPGEVAYLLDGVNALFTDRQLKEQDLQATYTGFRPIIDTRTIDPARAARDYGVWVEDGLITVTGGKLTTHRSVARQVMKRVTPRLMRWTDDRQDQRTLCVQRESTAVGNRPESERYLLAAHYGPEAVTPILEMSEAEHHPLPGVSGLTLAELRWAARTESVMHLDDLLARRTRIALLAPGGGAGLLNLIEPIARQELGWDERRWLHEVDRYRAVWSNRYAPKSSATGSPVQMEKGLRRVG